MSDYIDLSKLPAPDVIEPLNYEAIFNNILTSFIEQCPEFNAHVESEPLYKILQIAAYREMILRQRINTAAQSVMLAHARTSDLDHLAALFNVQRQILTVRDNNATPPIPPTYETDERLRHRILLSLDGLSTAGPIGSYRYHSLSASAHVKDVSITSPQAGQVLITLLSTQGDGTAPEELIDTVNTAVNDDNVRPLTDRVTVQSADILPYEINATLICKNGPDNRIIHTTVSKNIQQYNLQQHKIHQTIRLSGLYAACHISGVEQVILHQPQQDINTQMHQAPYCRNVSINVQVDS